MIITETSLTPDQYRAWLRERDAPPRTPGIHVSDVLRRMLVDIGRYEKDAVFNDVRGDLGFAWEDVLSTVLAGRMADESGYVRLPMMELERDGIYGSPDGVLLDAATDEFFIEETKATWMSATHAIDSPKLLPWVMQGKTYCCLAGCTRLRIRAFFVNGNYKFDGAGPTVREWWITFTARELAEWWSAFTRMADKIRREQVETA
jgi:hypothetical protein